ncbi:MAG: GNAT family N-acetyltransferase [Pseudanabaenaceae cyanobacterium SKYGB_i_bin29]|nr:GNAT family N-acetyltransferase [Pseudanabaenaceae cyanobacterium SKYG29]MDW8421891.1 GNAT family N-acetyltransferase [Pseudanabaenaceae cyanobacterium SKYGB_i_bin29]
MPIDIVPIAYASPDYYQALALRNLYLRQPLGLSFTAEEEQEDQIACHVVAKHNDRVIGCVLGVPKEDWVKIRQMVVQSEYQRQGIGTKLLQTVEKIFNDRGKTAFFLHARHHSVEFYRKNGYQPIGALFYEVGILHRRMEKHLT